MKHTVAAAFITMLSWAALDLSAQQDSGRTRFLRDIRIEAGETVSDAICFNCSITVEGQLDGDAVAIGGDIFVHGTLRGDAVSLGGKIHALPGCRVDADLVAVCGTVRADPGANVTGDIDSLPYFHMPGQRSVHPLGAFLFSATNVVIWPAVGSLIGVRRSENLAGTVRRHPWMTAVAGLTVTMLYMLLIVLAGMLPRFDDSLVILVTFAFLVLCTYGYVGMAWFAGRNIAGGRSRLVVWLTGSLAVTILFLVPVAGFMAFVAISLLAQGSAVLSRFGSDPDRLCLQLFRVMRSRPWIDAAGIV